MSANDTSLFDPFTAPVSPELIRVLWESPALHGLLSSSLRELRETAKGRGEGTLCFLHHALRGPPGRLHGGLHCVARTLLIAAHLPTFWPERDTFPCAFSVRIGAKIELQTDVSFRYTTHAEADRRFLVTRVFDNPRLEAALWSLPKDSADYVRQDLRLRFAPRLKEPVLSVSEHVGLRYEHHPELSVLHFSPAILREPVHAFRAFQTADGSFIPALATYYLDNVAAASRMAQLDHPCFTTRLGLSLFSAVIPADRPLVFAATRARQANVVGARGRGVLVHGRIQGTETCEVFLVDESFERVFAWGWVDTHPIGDVLSQSR